MTNHLLMCELKNAMNRIDTACYILANHAGRGGHERAAKMIIHGKTHLETALKLIGEMESEEKLSGI